LGENVSDWLEDVVEIKERRWCSDNQSTSDLAAEAAKQAMKRGNIAPESIDLLILAASMTSAATFVINPGFIANYGLSGVISFGIVFPLGALLSLIVLTKSFRKYGQQVKALTLAQWMGERY